MIERAALIVPEIRIGLPPELIDAITPSTNIFQR